MSRKRIPQVNQEMMSKRHQKHMVMPPQPTTRLIMVKTDLAFIFFEDSLDGPPHTADAHKLAQGSFNGSIAIVELDHGRIVQIAADDQPDFRARQVGSRFKQAQESKIAYDGPLTTFFDGGFDPNFCRKCGKQVINLNRTVIFIAQTVNG